ncbi:hypothetical protein [Clostridium tetanomorphum]|nr:hypothetical protein [Clostridium tetanomorphum]MBP1864298.1 hypothetical protein [Clostridium tetanomorphum]NRZ96935.1 hypothetical protein [Clostridium tetanomorphum]
MINLRRIDITMNLCGMEDMQNVFHYMKQLKKIFDPETKNPTM